MVDWILRYLRMRTRAEAAELGQRLLTANYIVAVTGKKNQFTEGQVFKFAVKNSFLSSSSFSFSLLFSFLFQSLQVSK
jgi:hypothetical protein